MKSSKSRHPAHIGQEIIKAVDRAISQTKAESSATSPANARKGYLRSKCLYYQIRYCVHAMNCERYMRDGYRPKNNHQLNLSLCKEEYCPLKVTTQKQKV